MEEDRRSGKRIECFFPLEFIIQKKKVKVNAINISNSGICFQCEEPIPLFRELEIKLLLPQNENVAEEVSIDCTGIVVRCDKKNETYDTALFFMDISMANQNRLTTYIENYFPKNCTT